MMKCEFEQLIDKEVDDDIFEMYEKMYMALPENVSKQEFVKTLNVAEIPEGDSAIVRRAERNAFIADIKEKIDGLKADLEFTIKYHSDNAQYIKFLKAEIRDLKFIIA